MKYTEDFIEFLKDKSLWVRRETLLIHKISQDTRIASSLSCVEIFVALYYGKILNFKPSDPNWDSRDRFIISKGHGAISFYPILADLGYFNKSELKRVGKEGSFLGGIPDYIIPGFETTNGSLGHGLGVACGMSLALKRKNRNEKVFVLLGDGELYEGSVWEAVMFAGQHRLDNLILIIDSNKICMLDYCKNILDLDPMEEKFKVFKWDAKVANGHDVNDLCESFSFLKEDMSGKPKVLIVNTVKGKGVSILEKDPLCHVKNLNDKEIESAIKGLQ
ncbi:MAG: transketolase [bacterium]